MLCLIFTTCDAGNHFSHFKDEKIEFLKAKGVCLRRSCFLRGRVGSGAARLLTVFLESYLLYHPAVSFLSQFSWLSAWETQAILRDRENQHDREHLPQMGGQVVVPLSWWLREDVCYCNGIPHFQSGEWMWKFDAFSPFCIIIPVTRTDYLFFWFLTIQSIGIENKLYKEFSAFCDKCEGLAIW